MDGTSAPKEIFVYNIIIIILAIRDFYLLIINGYVVVYCCLTDKK